MQVVIDIRRLNVMVSANIKEQYYRVEILCTMTEIRIIDVISLDYNY